LASATALSYLVISLFSSVAREEVSYEQPIAGGQINDHKYSAQYSYSVLKSSRRPMAHSSSFVELRLRILRFTEGSLRRRSTNDEE